MNFEDMQLIWNSQTKENMYAIDRTALGKLVEKDTLAIHQDLKALELSAIVALLFLGVATLYDTFFQGNEYFQLAGAALDFSAAGWLWYRRRAREAKLIRHPMSLVDQVENGIQQVRSTIRRGRDLTIFFTLFILYGSCIRMAIYGLAGSEIKLVASVICIAFLFVLLRINEVKVHLPRLKNFESLKVKLTNS